MKSAINVNENSKASAGMNRKVEVKVSGEIYIQPGLYKRNTQMDHCYQKC